MNAYDLMRLSESAAGFTGGTNYDALPHMSLAEATGTLPCVILEEQTKLYESVDKENEMLTEAAVSALTTGIAPDYNALIEASGEGLIAKIKAFFAKIKKWIMSIIAKIGVQIDKLRMSGKEMYNKYKNSSMLKGKSFKGLTYNGYEFPKNAEVAFTNIGTSAGDIDAFIAKAAPDGTIVTPEKFKTDADAAANIDDVKTKLENMKSVESSERRAAFAKELTGVDDENWSSELRSRLWGDKKDLTFGEDFTYDSVAKALEAGNTELKAVQDDYKKMRVAVEKSEKAMTQEASKYKKDDKNKPTEPGEPVAKKVTLVNEYYSAYLAIYQDATSVISSVQDVRTSYYTARYNQAKAIFAKMLTYKGGKEDESVAVDDDFDLDF